MLAWLVEIVLSALAVGLATWVSWERPAGVVGATLCLCFALSTASYFGSKLESRVVLELIQAGAIINTTRIAFAADRGYHLIAIVALSVLDIAFCVTVALGMISPRWLGFVYGTVTCAIFYAQCACVAAPGVRDAILARRRNRAAPGMVGRAYPAGHDPDLDA